MKTVAVCCDFSSADERLLCDFENLITSHIPVSAKSLKDESVYARVLLKYVLKEYFSVGDFSLTAEENGKPYLIGSNLHFNFSHCFKRIICTVSTSSVGCDVQDIRPFNPRVVSRFFSSDEGMILSASNNKDEHFTKLWVLKESVLKYKGDGISGGLSFYSFPEYLMSDSFKAYGANFKSFVKNGFVYGICHQTDDVTVFETEIKDIVKKMM